MQELKEKDEVRQKKARNLDRNVDLKGHAASSRVMHRCCNDSLRKASIAATKHGLHQSYRHSVRVSMLITNIVR